MANDLNFDELDKAVSTYMQKKDPTPSTPAPTPVAAPAPTTVPVATPAAEPPKPAESVAKPVVPPVTRPVATTQPRLQVRTRQSIASRRGASGSTFHDIVPNHRHSTVVPSKHLSPISDLSAASTPVPPAKTPLPEEATASASVPTVTDIKPPETPVVPQAPATEEPKAMPEPSKPTAPETPKILGDTTALPGTDSTEPAPVVTEPKTEEKSPEEDLLVRPDSNSAMSDALLEDLRKESEQAAKTATTSETPPAPAEEAAPEESTEPASSPSAAETPKRETEKNTPLTKGLLSETPLELEDSKTDIAPTSKAKETSSGLLDTGELHQNTPPASPIDTSHMLKAGADDPQSMQVFDTKEYHTPIATHEATPPKNKKWEVTIIVLVTAIVIAAAFVAYMMAFSNK